MIGIAFTCIGLGFMGMIYAAMVAAKRSDNNDTLYFIRVEEGKEKCEKK